ncbi:MlaA family lipoprotein [Trinickia soli]|uniref:ABC transporter n=1 Tax=Trinickia soli TaxID=380675 RepID=A0A2N7W9Y6_9BURK|nr:VacJ family lipoprotein [Trinickia soli]PMS26199.1 ABC transporter [Trinickia soli]CAB3678596.1 Intermembrane phospholipid transport system lipoprotein MlaA [Trinickia soli]
MDNLRTSAATLIAAALLVGCASPDKRTAGDPLEPMNRAIFKVNDTIDRTVAVPIAKGYQAVTPHPLRTAISNFFSNLGDLNNIANELLQLKITDATEDLIRFAMNTTFGIGGLIDFATPARLPKHHQDFGLTLGHWGIPSGPYLVLPIFGPSSFRDGVGLAVDTRFSPLIYAPADSRRPLYALQFVSARSDMLGATNILEQAALDKYSFVRDAYTQQRRAALGADSGKPPALPNYGDDDESSATPAAPNGASAAAPAAAASAVPPINAPAGAPPSNGEGNKQ